VRHLPAGLRRFVDIEFASQKALSGDLDGPVAALRTVIAEQFDTGEMVTRGPGTALLVELLIRRRANGDLEEMLTGHRPRRCVAGRQCQRSCHEPGCKKRELR
jgi:hypothetical protein